MTEMVERVADAIALANRVLGNSSAYPAGDLLATLAREFLRALEESAWRDISTAPRTGEEIFGISVNAHHIYGPWTMRWDRDAPKPDWQASWDGMPVIHFMTDLGSVYEDLLPPTHWQPLPAPPPEETPDV